MTGTAARTAYVVGTFDTKAEELDHVARLLRGEGLGVLRVDVGTRSEAAVEMPARALAAQHPLGAGAVFEAGDRGRAVEAMTEALERWIVEREDLGGIIGLGGGGGTAMVTAAMRRLPVGIPKIMVSTLASGNVAPFVGGSDITMIHPVTDIAGLNRISRLVLRNAAGALVGMMQAAAQPEPAEQRPAIGLTMFGVTTPCVERVAAALRGDWDCLVFHATGTGGRSMEALVDSGLLAAVIDVSTTEIADHLLGGVLSAGPDRLGAFLRRDLPWIGSVGALDMVNFWDRASVPDRHAGRRLHAHNPNVTLMRTTAEELAAIGRWMAERLNAAPGPVRLLLPEGGLSMIDAPGQPFHDPEAAAALFDALEAAFVQNERHRLLRLPLHINDPAFADALVAQFREVVAHPG